MVLLLKGDKKIKSVSVVIPTYNRASLVVRAVESVLAQKKRGADEIIVIDDGSTDHTEALLNPFRRKIRYIYQENRGVSAARNRGIKEAKSKWIAFLDSDDVWHPQKLHLQLSFLAKHRHFHFCHTNEIWIRNNQEIKQKKIHQKPQGSCFYENLSFCKIAPSTVMVEKTLLEEVGGFDEKMVVCEDYDLWLRLLRNYPIGLVEEALTIKYAGHGNQLSFLYHSMDRFRIEALLKHLPDIRVKEEIVKKLSILEKGAKRHQNDALLLFCQECQERLGSG